MFDDEKIKLIEDIPEADMILIIWIKLLTLAGKKNMNGYIFLTENIPYTDEMLATIFKRPLNTIRLALETFKKFNMINFNGNNVMKIVNWDKHQNIEAMAKLKLGNVLRKRNQRNRQNLLEDMYKGLSIDGSGYCAYCGEHGLLTLEHIIPIAKGGLDIIENLELVCIKCNRSKNDRDLAVYLNELAREDKKVIQKVINNKKIMTYVSYDKGVFTQKNVKLVVTVTPGHTLEEIREEKNRREEKKDIKESEDSFPSKSKTKDNDPLEFSFEDKCWWGLYDWRIKMYQGAFPMLTVNYLFNDKWKTKFLADPVKYKKMIKEKYEGDIAKLVWAWLQQAKKFYIRDHKEKG